MTDHVNTDAGTPARPLPYWKIGFAAALLLLIGTVDTWTSISDHARLDKPVATWEAFVWEFTSLLLIALLIPAVMWLNRRFPINHQSWKRTVPLNMLATVPFSVIHVTGMVMLRKLSYAAAGLHYDFGAPVARWFYEYRKDVVAYLLILVIGYALRFYLLYQQEKSAKNRVPPPADEPLQRLVVKKRNREFILNTTDIDQIEADGNYVTVYSQGSSYPLRDSLKSLEGKLDSRRFARVHRRHIVNIDRIREIQPWDHGDYRIVLKDGTFVNFSRRYRDRLACLSNLSAGHPKQASVRP